MLRWVGLLLVAALLAPLVGCKKDDKKEESTQGSATDTKEPAKSATEPPRTTTEPPRTTTEPPKTTQPPKKTDPDKGNSDKITKANFDKLQKGWTEDQIKEVLGEPTLTTPDLGFVPKQSTWTSGNKGIVVTYKNDKLEDKRPVGKLP